MPMSDDDLGWEQGVTKIPSLLHSPADCRLELSRAYLHKIHDVLGSPNSLSPRSASFVDFPGFSSLLLELVILSPSRPGGDSSPAQLTARRRARTFDASVLRPHLYCGRPATA